MAKLIAKKRILPDAGRHLCTLAAVEEIENQFFNPKKDGDDKKFRLGWEFTYDDKSEMKIRMWSSYSLSIWKGQKSSALEINEALQNKVLSKEEREAGVDTDNLIDRKAYLTVKHEKKDDGEILAKVINIEPAEQLKK